MVLLLTGSLVLLLILVLGAVLATATVVVRMATHMRDESWSRISAHQRRLRDREEEIRACAVCGSHHVHDVEEVS